MTGNTPIRAPITLTDMFGGFPLAYGVFAVAAVVFSLFNFGSSVASTTPVYARWLDASQPFTDAAASFVPAVDSATAFLEKHRDFLEEHHRLYWIPAVRNVLSINFALLLFFPSCFAVATCIDLFRDPERALNNVDAVSKRLKAPINQIILRCAICLLLFLMPVYFDFGTTSDPFLTGFTVTILYYVIVFGANGLLLFITIYLVISLAIIRLGLHPERKGRAAPD